MTVVILAIEASQRGGGVALHAGGAVDVEVISTAARHDDDLMPAVDRLLRRADVGPRDLSHVGVSIGPGGFTGLRISVTTAKMLAFALGVRVVGVPTALVVAEGSEPDRVGAGPIVVTLAAKRGSFWATTLRRAEGVWSIDAAPGALVDADRFDVGGLSAVLADLHLPETARARCEAAGVPVIEPSFDPRACLAVSRRLAAEGRYTDPLVLAPLYPRAPEAVRLWSGRREGP